MDSANPRGRDTPAWLRRAKEHWAVLVPFAFFLAVALPGVDFGPHWDEDHAHLVPLKRSIELGIPLPGDYTYPGVNYLVNCAALLPDAVDAWRAGGELAPALLRAVDTRAYRLRMRGLRVVLSSLAVLLLYAVALALGRPRREAWLAAALLAGSWEIVYHSRWPAPDTILVPFGLLSMLGALMTLRRRDRRWWPGVGAAGAALACGTKYPGGTFLFFVLLALVLTEVRSLREFVDLRRLAAHLGWPLLKAVFVFSAVYLASTPGTILEPRRFVSGLFFHMSLYRDSNFAFVGYTVGGPAEHLYRVLGYLALESLSPWGAASLAATALVPLGVAVLARQRPEATVLVLGFPVFYLLFFARQKILFVRNYNILIPFVALFVALGIGALDRRLAARPGALRVAGRSALALGVSALLLLGAAWQVDATRSIVARGGPDDPAPELAAYVDGRPSTRFLLSPRSAAALARDGKRRANVVEDSARGPTGSRSADRGPADTVIAYLEELGDFFPANRLPPAFETWFGPREVNLNYYPSWRGDDRPVVLKMDRALEFGLVLPQVFRRRLILHQVPDAGKRQAVVRAGNDAGGDLLFLEGLGRSRIRFGLEHWGGEGRWVRSEAPVAIKTGHRPGLRPVSPELELRPGRPYALAVSWDAYGGQVTVELDGHRVFAAEHDLVLAGLDEFAVAGEPGG